MVTIPGRRRKERARMAGKLYRPAVDERRVVDVGKKPNDARTAYRRDLARLIHSPCFRRLQGKA
jgi:dGTP triphosphohydrolase